MLASTRGKQGEVMSEPQPPSGSDAGNGRNRDLLVLVTLAAGFVMALIDTTAVNVALPDLSQSLSVELAGLVWIVDGYTLTFASFLLAGGALADRFGPKLIYQAGLVLFVVASILCAVAPSPTMLIAARLLQGVGASIFMPSSLSLLSHAYKDADKRRKMVGIWSAMAGASSAFGPLVGGVLVHSFGWRSVFWVNVPIGVLGVVLAQVLLAPAPKHPRSLSPVSHALGAVVLAALSFFLIEGPTLGWLATPVLAAAIITVLAALMLTQRERSGKHPLLPPALFEAAGFVGINITGFLINFGAFGQLFVLSLYLQEAAGASALETGLQIVPTMITITAGNLLSSKVSTHIGLRRTMWFGFGVAALCALGLAISARHIPITIFIAGVGVMNLFLGGAIPAMTATVMQLAGRSHANGAAAALNANRQIGALVGVALMGTILHVAGSWNMRLELAFGSIAAVYALAGAVVFRSAGLRGLPIKSA
jgi:DHA2 family methylenomycin A resistance protein-like MFS transporter